MSYVGSSVRRNQAFYDENGSIYVCMDMSGLWSGTVFEGNYL